MFGERKSKEKKSKIYGVQKEKKEKRKKNKATHKQKIKVKRSVRGTCVVMDQNRAKKCTVREGQWDVFNIIY